MRPPDRELKEKFDREVERLKAINGLRSVKVFEAEAVSDASDKSILRRHHKHWQTSTRLKEVSGEPYN